MISVMFKARKPRTKKAKSDKFGRVMHEYKTGELRSGSKHGPVVTNRKQAIAIAASEAGIGYGKAMSATDISAMLGHCTMAEVEAFAKAGHKYLRREGSKGHYRYVYHEKQGKRGGGTSPKVSSRGEKKESSGEKTVYKKLYQLSTWKDGSVTWTGTAENKTVDDLPEDNGDYIYTTMKPRDEDIGKDGKIRNKKQYPDVRNAGKGMNVKQAAGVGGVASESGRLFRDNRDGKTYTYAEWLKRVEADPEFDDPDAFEEVMPKGKKKMKKSAGDEVAPKEAASPRPLSGWAVSNAIDAVSRMRIALTDADVATKIETVKATIGPRLPEGAEKLMVMSKLDALKPMKTMDDQAVDSIVQVVRSLVDLMCPRPMQKAVPESLTLEALDKAKYLKRTGSPGHYRYVYERDRGTGKRRAESRKPLHTVSEGGARIDIHRLSRGPYNEAGYVAKIFRNGELSAERSYDTYKEAVSDASERVKVEAQKLKNREDMGKSVLKPSEVREVLAKAKYLKRTGSPGHYRYQYKHAAGGGTNYEVDQKTQRSIRKQMHEDGLSEYDAYGHVTKEATEAWESEFQRRLSKHKDMKAKSAAGGSLRDYGMAEVASALESVKDMQSTDDINAKDSKLFEVLADEGLIRYEGGEEEGGYTPVLTKKGEAAAGKIRDSIKKMAAHQAATRKHNAEVEGNQEERAYNRRLKLRSRNAGRDGRLPPDTGREY